MNKKKLTVGELCRVSGILPAITGFFLLTGIYCYPMSGKAENVPMKPYKNLILQNGEILRYRIERGGENVSEFKFVTILSNDPDGRYANIYHHGIDISKNEKYPVDYTNYIAKFLISMDRATLLENVYGDNSVRTNELPRLNRKGQVTIYKKSVYDNKTSEIFMESVTRNETGMQYRKNRIKLKPGFPVLDLGSGIVMGIRFLDTSGPGLAVFVIPEIVKEPLPVTFRFIGREKIQTKAGDFNTVKIGFRVADTFLGKLMRSFTDETFMWIEDSDRRILIKMKSPDNDFILEEISNTGE